MIRLFALVLLWPSIALAQPAVVQLKTYSGLATTNRTLLMDSAITANNTLAFAYTVNSSTDTLTVSDDLNGSWTQNTHWWEYTDGTSKYLVGYRFLSAAGGSPTNGTLTIARSSVGSNRHETLSFYEISGVGEVDHAFNTETSASSATHNLWSPAVDISANAIAISIFNLSGTATVTGTPGSGTWAQRVNYGTQGYHYTGIFSSAAASFGGQFTISTGRNWTSAAIVLKEASGSSAVPSIVQQLYGQR